MFAVCACALGLQVQQKEDGIFINQDKYVYEIFKKLNYLNVKSASDLVDLEDSLFELCKKQTVVATSTTEAKFVAAASCCSGPRCQDTILGDVNAQTRFEITSKQSIDPPLSRGYTLGSGEDINAVRLKLVLSVFVSAVKRMLMLPVQDFSGRITPLFDTMMVQPVEEMGEDSDHPTDSTPIPIIDQPSSSSQPKKDKSSKKAQRQDGHGEDSMQLTELMVLCTKLQTQVLDLQKAKDAQAKEIAALKKRI
ncbi:hypothetical protein Tco_1185292 [Tanacetum coccineum]